MILVVVHTKGHEERKLPALALSDRFICSVAEFAGVRTDCFRNPMQAEDQELSGNFMGLYHQIWTEQTSTLRD